MVDMEDLIKDNILLYQELNGFVITELKEEPSPLEFLRYVKNNRPFVVRNCIMNWPAVKLWKTKYLKEVMKDKLVNIAITPKGNADSVVEHGKSGLKYFTKPLERLESFEAFLNDIQKQEFGSGKTSIVKYAQTQNDNLREEYQALFPDVEKDITWARIALETEPEAINLWIGNSKTTTALHRDNYENIYGQIIGSKHFVLIPPIETACVNEKTLPSATYAFRQRIPQTEEVEAVEMDVVPDAREVRVPCAIWDPDVPEEELNAYSRLSKPIRVSLDPGDILYLPALWYHKVSQSCGTEGICCAVNYWYDMDFGGVLYSSAAFMRSVALAMTSSDAL